MDDEDDLSDALREHGFQPSRLDGDVPDDDGPAPGSDWQSWGDHW